MPWKVFVAGRGFVVRFPVAAPPRVGYNGTMNHCETMNDHRGDLPGDQFLLDFTLDFDTGPDATGSAPDATRGGDRRPGGAALPPPDRMYRALLERDASFDGLFLVAVRTTGIYCRPTCNVRKPKRENVEFFAGSAEAAERIRAGGKVVEAAFESGWESLSGFADSFRRASGRAPKRGAARVRIVTSRVETSFGPMIAGAVDAGICLFEFADRRMLATQYERLRARLGAELYPGDHPHLAALADQIGEYFAGRRAAFDLPLVLAGTPFQETVWRELMTIPSGAVRSYAEQARRIGRPEAVRAVARANGDNRIAILIPCHRVIGADGRLVGYGGGLWRKRYLLDLEAKATGSGSTA